LITLDYRQRVICSGSKIVTDDSFEPLQITFPVVVFLALPPPPLARHLHQLYRLRHPCLFFLLQLCSLPTQSATHGFGSSTITLSSYHRHQELIYVRWQHPLHNPQTLSQGVTITVDTNPPSSDVMAPLQLHRPARSSIGSATTSSLPPAASFFASSPRIQALGRQI
jgi:hypothetical protein